MTDDAQEVPTIAIAVKTIDRGAYPPKTRNYLGETMANLERAGVFSSPHLHSLTLVDSGSPDPDTFFEAELGCTPDTGFINLHGQEVWVDIPDERRNYHRNAQHAIRIAAESGATWAMVIEDDIDVCSEFLESAVSWLADHKQPSPMMYVFGANYSHIRNLYRKGGTVWTYGVGGFYGALCCAWSPEDALDLVEWYGPDPAYLNKNGSKIYGRGHDLMLARWGKERGIKHFLATVPCFIQHIGLESGLGNRVIEYAGWRGRGYSYVTDRHIRTNRP
jgi:hypothetical protein